MKVAYFHDAPRLGGAERYLADLCRGVAAAGAEVLVVTPESPLVPYLEQELSTAASLRVLPPRPPAEQSAARKLAGTAQLFARTRKVLRAVDPDLLHINNGGYPGSHLSRLAAFGTSCPRLMTVHAVAQERASRFASAHRAFDSLLWRRLEMVVCGTETAARELISRRELPPEKSRVISYGVAEPETEPADVEALRRSLDADGCLLVGMVAAPDTESDVAFKGHDVLLGAITALDGREVRAVIVGHDPGPSFRGRAAANGVSESVTVLGRVLEIEPYMAAFDVLVVPSTRYESLPLVVLEAMAAGTPVIASRLSGIPEAVVDGETGYTFEPGESRQLADLLTRCAEDRALVKRLGVGARRLYEARFGAKRMVDETLGLYRELQITQ